MRNTSYSNSSTHDFLSNVDNGLPVQNKSARNPSASILSSRGEVTPSDGRDRKSSPKSERRVHRKKDKSPKRTDLGSFLTDTAPEAPDSDDEDNDLFTMFTWSTETISQSQLQEQKGKFKDTALKPSMTMEEKSLLVTELLGQGPSGVRPDEVSPPRPRPTEKDSSWTDAVIDPDPEERVYKLGASLRDTKTYASRKTHRSGEGSLRGSARSSGEGSLRGSARSSIKEEKTNRQSNSKLRAYDEGNDDEHAHTRRDEVIDVEAISAATKSRHRTKSVEPTDVHVKSKAKGQKSHKIDENSGGKSSRRTIRSRAEDAQEDKLSAPKQRRCKSVDPFDELNSSRSGRRLDVAPPRGRSNSVDPAFDPSFFNPQPELKRNKSVALYDQFLGDTRDGKLNVNSKSCDTIDGNRRSVAKTNKTELSFRTMSFSDPYTASFRMPPVRSKSNDIGVDDRSNAKFDDPPMLSHRNQSDEVCDERKPSKSSKHLLKSTEDDRCRHGVEGRKSSRSRSPKLESSSRKLKSSSASRSTPVIRSNPLDLHDRVRANATFDDDNLVPKHASSKHRSRSVYSLNECKPSRSKPPHSKSSDPFEDRVSSALARKHEKKDKKKDKKVRSDDDDEFMPNMMTVDLRDLLGVAMMEVETPVANNRPQIREQSTQGKFYDFERVYEDDFGGGHAQAERMPAW
jgi:hypothetical protein